MGYFNNHYYLILLFNAQLVVVDASSKSRVVPRWHVLLLRYQLAAVYVFGGLSKLNSDWIAGWPVRKWMNAAFEDAIEEVLPELNGNEISEELWWFKLIPESVTMFLVFGGLLFDLLIVPCMSMRSTRTFGAVLILTFHTINLFLFDIGVFPLLGIFSMVLFYDAEDLPAFCVRSCCCEESVVEGRGGEEEKEEEINVSIENRPALMPSVFTLCFLFLFGFLQLLLPLRHYFYHSGTNQIVGWTGNGEFFSWRMMLTSKECTGHFVVTFDSSDEDDDRSNQMKVEVASLGLNQKQEWRAFQHPSYTIQLARFMASSYSVLGADAVEGERAAKRRVQSIRVVAECELNGNHLRQLAMNSTKNLLDDDSHVNLWLPLVN